MKKKKFDWLWIGFIVMSILALISCLMVCEFAFRDNGNFHPHNRISDADIIIKSDKIIINGNFQTGIFTGTKSMIPLLFKNATTIDFIPKSPDEVYVGDLISFHHKDYLICHRVIKKDYDSKGVYFITKGDNNYIRDLYKIRFEDIKDVSIGVIW